MTAGAARLALNPPVHGANARKNDQAAHLELLAKLSKRCAAASRSSAVIVR